MIELPTDLSDNTGCAIPTSICIALIILCILCLGEPDILDGIIRIVNNIQCTG